MSTDTETCSGRRTDIAPDDGVQVGSVAPGAAAHPTNEPLAFSGKIVEHREQE